MITQKYVESIAQTIFPPEMPELDPAHDVMNIEFQVALDIANNICTNDLGRAVERNHYGPDYYITRKRSSDFEYKGVLVHIALQSEPHFKAEGALNENDRDEKILIVHEYIAGARNLETIVASMSANGPDILIDNGNSDKKTLDDVMECIIAAHDKFALSFS